MFGKIKVYAELNFVAFISSALLIMGSEF